MPPADASTILSASFYTTEVQFRFSACGIGPYPNLLFIPQRSNSDRCSLMASGLLAHFLYHRGPIPMPDVQRLKSSSCIFLYHRGPIPIRQVVRQQSVSSCFLYHRGPIPIQLQGTTLALFSCFLYHRGPIPIPALNKRFVFFTTFYTTEVQFRSMFFS